MTKPTLTSILGRLFAVAVFICAPYNKWLYWLAAILVAITSTVVVIDAMKAPKDSIVQPPDGWWDYVLNLIILSSLLYHHEYIMSIFVTLIILYGFVKDVTET